MKNHIVSSLKYLLKLAILLAAIYGAMYATGTLGITTEELLGTKGVVLAVAVVALAAAYPAYGFVSRTVKASLTDDREEILGAMRQNGYSLHSEGEGTMLFRASAPLKRLWHLGDEKISVRAIDSDHIELRGVRKEVVQSEFRLTSYLIGKRGEQQ
ncbi:MAG: hypothetical protein IKM41_01505 [Tidjanibacter sp.]|nr:hypothetical protein [Tidjanibacter sp.]MBR3853216.1 hypothetical protein [Tidjanibacter sp.]